MRSSIIHLSTLVLLLVASLQVAGQRNCGTVEYMSQLGNTESKEALENWIYQKQLESPSSGQKSFNVEATTIYQIPVVVHIIHNGESIGVGSNISESQILSQLDVLNEDFRKLNADSVNIPIEFKSFYSDIGFEFVMAKRDPSNSATNGITRTKGSQTSWGMSNDTALKGLSYWPSEDYLNIWVAPLSGGLLGWAQFPQSSVLDGLEPPYNDTTDGVVIAYDAYGSKIIDPSANLQSRFDLGRTATHEIGHFFGLRHIWGDGGCSMDDYVTDTPTAEADYGGCPSMGGSTTTCTSQDMFMNYMDYVDDACMNIFSHGQKDRMVIIMENSPRRLSLTTSLGLMPPNSDDLALIKFITPGKGICANSLSTIIEVKNIGLSSITDANLSLFINNTQVLIQDFNFNLAVNETLELTFNSILLNEFGNLEFKAKVETVNGNIDGFPANDTIATISLRAESVQTLFEDFTSSNPQWTVRTDQAVSALDYGQSVFYSVSNTSAAFNYYNSIESTDAYISPKLAIGNTSKILLFDYAYAYSGLDDDFSVYASTDCGNNFSDVLFSSIGENLATTTSPVEFYPSGAEDWQHVQVDLTNYTNQEVIFAFSGKSAGGNRILFDNIQVVANSYNDIALVGLTTPSMICNEQGDAILWIENKGTQHLSNLDISVQLGSTITNINYSQLNLPAGEIISLPLPTSSTSKVSEIQVTLLTTDDNNTNNGITQTIIPVTSITEIPFRESFNSSELSDNWALVGKGSDIEKGWALSNNQLEFIATNSPAKGLKESIILPSINLSNLASASMHFDFAYAFDGINEELLRVKASRNCGESYETLFIEGGEELATNIATVPWQPSSELDWRNIYVDLSAFAGSESVQIIIELTSAQGNNAFINNIELYASNIETPLKLIENTITTYPNPSTQGTVNISFNLEKSQPATLLIYNSQGSFVLQQEISNALNQTFEIATAHLQNGLYFARLVGDQIDISRSFMVNQ